jgi:hypothetical protein
VRAPAAGLLSKSTAKVGAMGSAMPLPPFRLIHPEIDCKTQLGKVRLTIEPDPSIRAGMFARASIYASRSYGISVPRSAVHFGTDGTSVQVVRNNVIETRGARHGLCSEVGTIEVREGVKPRRVTTITNGVFKVFKTGFAASVRFGGQVGDDAGDFLDTSLAILFRQFVEVIGKVLDQLVPEAKAHLPPFSFSAVPAHAAPRS